MKKIEGVVIFYDDGSRERISAADIMARFLVPVPHQESNEERLEGEPLQQEDRSVPKKNVEPVENTLGNESFPQESHFTESSTTGLNPGNGNPPAKKKQWQTQSIPTDVKDYLAATVYLFPYGGDRLRNKTLLECVVEDRAFMKKVAENSKGKNAELARHIRLVLDRNPVREGESL